LWFGSRIHVGIDLEIDPASEDRPGSGSDLNIFVPLKTSNLNSGSGSGSGSGLNIFVLLKTRAVWP